MIATAASFDSLPMVLIVDDLVTNLDVAISHLGQEALDVRAALSGEEGLELAHELQPDLILLDVMMPGITGYEVCRRVKQDPELKHIPVVFLSALGEEPQRQRGFDVGGADYIQKPFRRDELRASVWKHLYQASSW